MIGRGGIEFCSYDRLVILNGFMMLREGNTRVKSGLGRSNLYNVGELGSLARHVHVFRTSSSHSGYSRGRNWQISLVSCRQRERFCRLESVEEVASKTLQSISMQCRRLLENTTWASKFQRVLRQKSCLQLEHERKCNFRRLDHQGFFYFIFTGITECSICIAKRATGAIYGC